MVVGSTENQVRFLSRFIRLYEMSFEVCLPVVATPDVKDGSLSVFSE